MDIENKFLLIIILILLPTITQSQIRNAPLTARDINSATSNYQKYCALCHGENREGNAADFAPSLKSKSLLSTMPLNFLASSIALGRPNTAMAPYIDEMGGPLNMKEIFNLASWIKYKGGHQTIALPQTPIKGNIKNGFNLYDQECATCHGKKGEGVTAPAIGNSAFLAFATDEYIKYAIENGRDSTLMLPYKNKLTEEQINDLTAYIRSLTSGWNPEARELIPFPKESDYVMNKNGDDPVFKLINDRYVPMKQVLDAINSKKKMVILDTRTTSEWHKAHIPGAIPIPYYISEDDVAKGLPKDGTWIIAYCSCPHAASDKIINMLRKKGYPNTAVIDEGFFAWLSNNYPVNSGQID